MAFTKDQQDEFRNLAKPLIKWINDNGDPHMSIIIDNSSGVLLSGEISVNTQEYWRD